MENKIWEKKCYKYVIFGVDQIKKTNIVRAKKEMAISCYNLITIF